MRNTIKTAMGYYLTLLRKYMPFSLANNTVEDVFNYLQISERVSTSGQPTERQFELIREQGFRTVINLAPHSAENALKDEQALLTTLGINYIHIPVDFKNPTEDDFNMFVSKMQDVSTEKVWIHCAANMRVSAFMFKYRCMVLNDEPDNAKKDLDKIWQPSGVWKTFLSELN